MDRTTLTRNLNLLKKQDFIKIESSSDKRKRIVTMTNKGKAQMTKALPLWERAQGIIIEKFGKGNWREIKTGLNEISNIARFNQLYNKLPYNILMVTSSVQIPACAWKVLAILGSIATMTMNTETMSYVQTRVDENYN